MNEKEQNLYESLMNISKIASQNLKELELWKDLAIGRRKDIKALGDRWKEAEDKAYKIVLYWYNKYLEALHGTLQEFSRNSDEYLNKYIGANQIYEAIFGIFRYTSFDGTENKPDDKRK